MAIAEKHIDEIVALYDGGQGDSVAEIHAAYPAISKPAIVYHLKKRGVYVELEKRMSEDASDAKATADDLNALLSNPALAAVIDQMIASRVAQLTATPAAPSSDMGALAASLQRMIELNATQQPGYIKPLPLDVIERRAAGKVEMFALLEAFEKKGTPPRWIVGEGGFVECTNMQEFANGDIIRTYLPPVEDFIPDNDEAEQVFEAMMKWLDGPTPDIGIQLRDAQLRAKEPQLVGNVMAAAKPALVEKIQVDKPVSTAASRRRTMGTIVPERKMNTPAANEGIVGPAFAEA